MTRSISLAATLLLSAAAVQAQTGESALAFFNPLQKLIPREIIRFQPGGPADEPTFQPVDEQPVMYLSTAKKVSAAYEGFAIELASADRPLLRSHEVFRKFGSIKYDRTAEGKYSYFILVPFTSKKSATSFAETVIKPRCVEAKLLEYVEGKRK